jgi:hypothetical protein
MRLLGLSLLAALTLALAALTLAAQAASAGWAPVTGSTGIINDVGKVRAPDGTLHVVWQRTTPAPALTTSCTSRSAQAERSASRP